MTSLDFPYFKSKKIWFLWNQTFGLLRSIFYYEFRVNLVLLKDNKNAWIAAVVHTTVIEAFAHGFSGRTDKMHVTAGIVTHQNPSHKHLFAAVCRLRVLIRVGGISGKITSWVRNNQKNKFNVHCLIKCGLKCIPVFIWAAYYIFECGKTIHFRSGL